MRFNTHCHVFNFQSVFDPATATILDNRLVNDHRVPQPIATAILNTLRNFLANGGGFNSVSDDNDFSAPAAGFVGRIDELWEAMHLAMLKNMDLVTDDMLLRQLGPDVIITPLMMDILIAPQPPGTQDPLFDAQVAGTKRQIARYPGRILPFYAVNPYRDGCAQRAVEALEHDGFVGVKLYPSLGYPITYQGMDDVMRHCNANQVPVLMHCNHGGFKQSDAAVGYCAPSLWGGADGYLETYPNLKICFGHFGGEENFTLDGAGNQKNVLTDASWTKDILDLMTAYPGRVFADVSFHEVAYLDNPLQPTQESLAYFQNLAAIMEKPGYQNQILWGSDTWLLRLVCTEADYWGAFLPMDDASRAHFKLMSEDNPRAFLGIDAVNPKPNVLKYMTYMQTNAGWSHDDAVAWLKNAAG